VLKILHLIIVVEKQRPWLWKKTKDCRVTPGGLGLWEERVRFNAFDAKFDHFFTKNHPLHAPFKTLAT
jgi:hypothetical protein